VMAELQKQDDKAAKQAQKDGQKKKGKQ
jgi:glycyl-tRNA synthetase alpha chain